MKPTLSDQLGNSLSIISSTARTAFVASHFILALGSGFAIMYLVINSTGDSLAPWLAYLLAWLGSLVWYRAIENPLRRFILFAWAYRLTEKEERKALSANLQRTGKASGVVTTILLTVTLSLSLLINVDVAEAVTSEQDSSKEIGQVESLTGSYNNDVALLRQQLDEARAQDARDVADAKKYVASLIIQAQNSKGAKMSRLARSGNGWARKQIASAVNRATKKGERHLASVKASATAPALQKRLNEYISSSSANRDQVATMTTQLVVNRQNQYLSTKDRRNWMLFIAVVFVVVVFVYTSRLLVLACLETGEELDNDPGEGVAKVAGRKVSQVNAWLGAKIDKLGHDKFVVQVASQSAHNVSVRPNLQQTDSTPPKPQQTKQEPTPPKQTTDNKQVSVCIPDGNSVGFLHVEIDGRQYNANQASDKMRTWYARWKKASTDKTADRNRQKYLSAKDQLSEYFTFVESAKSVKIVQR